MKSKILLSILIAVIVSFSSNAQGLTLKELANNLTGNESWGKSWKISGIEKRELGENGPIGEFEDVALSMSSIGDFMASSRLPDSITFKINYNFEVNVFTGNFWRGSSDDVHRLEWAAGIWDLKKSMLRWECPDHYVFDANITDFGKEFFVISGAVEYGSEAFEYFEYRVKYEVVDDGMTH